MIAQSVRDNLANGPHIEIINCYLKESLKQRLFKTLAASPDIICFSIYLWNAEAALAMIRSVKRSNSKITIIAGGALPSALPEEFASIEEIDHVLPGEAENTLPVLINSLITGRKQPAIIPQGPTPCLSELSSPYLTGLIDPADYRGALWELSRGCPYRCAFCFESRGTSGIRRFPEQRLQSELNLFLASGIPEILVLDPTFNYNATIAKRNLRMICNAATDIHFTFEIRAEHLDQEMAELFAAIHCTLQIGLQSIHPNVLQNIQRSCDTTLFRDKVYLLHEQQVPYGFDLIYGLPGDTLTGFLESIDFTFSLAPNHVDIFPLAVIPGTTLYDKAAYHGLDFQPDNGYLVEQTPSFSKQEMKSATRIARFAEHFYNQGKAVSWFDLMLSNLHISASKFFCLGAERTPERDYRLDPLAFQLTVLKQLWDVLNPDFSLLLLRDLIVYFWHYNGVFSESTDAPQQHNSLYFNPSLRLDCFTYTPQDIIEAIEQGIDDFAVIEKMLTQQELVLAFVCYDDQLSCLECSRHEYEILKKLLEKPKGEVEFPNNLSDESIERFIAAGIATPLDA